MAVVGKAKERLSSRSHAIDDKGMRRFTRVFVVETDGYDTGPVAVRGAVAVPKLFDFYNVAGEVDLGARVRKIEPERVDDSLIWEVRVEYSTDAQDEQQADEDPLARPALISTGWSQFTRALEKDLDDKAVVTAADEPFDPPVEVDDDQFLLTIQRNEAFLDEAKILTYRNAVNSDPWRIAQPKQAKIRITAQRRFENGIEFYEYVYTISFNEEGWQPSVLHRGMYVKDGTTRKLATDKDGQNVTAPVLLDAAGAQLAIGGTPVFLDFKGYRERPFAPLNL